MPRTFLLVLATSLLTACAAISSVSSSVSSAVTGLWPGAEESGEAPTDAGIALEAGSDSAILLTDSACRAAFSRPAVGTGLEAPGNLALLNWNIGKTRRQGWVGDLRRLSLGKQLVLLQEATDDMLGNPILPPYRDLAPGFSTNLDVSGVATFSTMEPDVTCHLNTVDAILRLPRAMQITRYPLGDAGSSLAVANIHMNNLSPDFTAYRRQLDRLISVLEVHEGAVIVSGDFNSWSNARYRLLSRRMDAMGARVVGFPEGGRSRFIGETVDHVFVAGLTVEEARAHDVDSSDHNPLSLRFSL